MDPRTGQMLAMANAPELDPNNWRKAPAGPRRQPGRLRGASSRAAPTRSSPPRRRWRRAWSPRHACSRSPDHIRCADRVFHDSHPHATGAADLRRRAGQVQQRRHHPGQRSKIGSERALRDAAALRLRRPPGVGLPGEEAGLLPDWQELVGHQRYTIAYGQGVSVNALQMASVYQTIANGGVRVAPTSSPARPTSAARFTRPRPASRPGWSARGPPRQITTMLEAAVERRGHRRPGRRSRVPGRGQDRHRQTVRPAARALRRLHGVLRRASPPPTTRGWSCCRAAEPHRSGHYGGRWRPRCSRT